MASRNFVRRGPRRMTQWVGSGDFDGTSDIPQWRNVAAGEGNRQIIATGVISVGGAGVAEERATLTRTIGRVNVALNETTAVVTSVVRVGLIKVRSEAIGIGISALPVPSNSPDADWIFFGHYALRNGNDTAQQGPLSAVSEAFDVKGQRKLDSGEGFVWIAEAAVSAVQVQVDCRYLLKLT